MKLGFNTSGNNQTTRRTTAAVNLGFLRNAVGSTSRKFKYCNARSPDLNYTFNCVFNIPIPPEIPTPLDILGGNIQTIVTDNGYVYLSNNYGKTWIKNRQLANLNYSLSGIAISSDGVYQTTSNNENITYEGSLISNNSGNTWSLSQTQPQRFFFFANSICMSSSGQYQFAVNKDISIIPNIPNLIYRSTDYGVTWLEPSDPPLDFIPPNYTSTYQISINSISCSSTGEKLVAVGINEYVPTEGILYFNPIGIIDYGNSWGTNQLYTENYLIYAGISGDGNVISLGYYNTSRGNVKIKTSFNNTSNFNTGQVINGPNGDLGIYCISLSYTGQYQIASNCAASGAGTNSNGYIYITTDYGANWHYISQISGVPTVYMQWNYVNISPSGQTMVAVGYYDDFQYPIPNTSNWYVYSRDYGETWNSTFFGKDDILTSIAIN